MKKFSLLAAAVTAASLTLSATPASSTLFCTEAMMRAETHGINPDYRRSNVPTCDGEFVSGFQIISGEITWYADHMHRDKCFEVRVNFLPEHVSAYDLDEVLTYLGLDRSSLDIYEMQSEVCL